MRSGDTLTMLPIDLWARLETGTLYSQRNIGLPKSPPPDDEGQCFTGHLSVQEELQAFKEFLVFFLCLQLFPAIFLLCCHLLQRRFKLHTTRPPSSATRQGLQLPSRSQLLHASAIPYPVPPCALLEGSTVLTHPICREFIGLRLLYSRHHHSGQAGTEGCQFL